MLPLSANFLHCLKIPWEETKMQLPASYRSLAFLEDFVSRILTFELRLFLS